jgi:hypothetical protein
MTGHPQKQTRIKPHATDPPQALPFLPLHPGESTGPSAIGEAHGFLLSQE